MSKTKVKTWVCETCGFHAENRKALREHKRQKCSEVGGKEDVPKVAVKVTGAPEVAAEAKQEVIPELPRSPSAIQDALDHLVWVHGDLNGNPNRAKLLKEYGLKETEVTESGIERALRHAKEKLEQSLVDHNRRPDKALEVQIPGSGGDLDPEVNPELTGPAKDRKEKAEREDADQKERLGQLNKAKEAAAQATEKAPKPAEVSTSAPKKGKRLTVTVLGHSLATVVRWLGYHGFNYQETLKVMEAFEVSGNPSSIKTYLTDGKREDEKYGPRAKLTEEEAQQLLTYKHKDVQQMAM